MRENKGITLVALIITIIVLLILAVVTISAVNEGSLFSHANNAATTYSKAQKEENTMISNWLTELAKHDGNKNEIKVVYKTWAERGVTNLTLNTPYYHDLGNGDSFYLIFRNETFNDVYGGSIEDNLGSDEPKKYSQEIDEYAQNGSGLIAYNGYGANESEDARTNYFRISNFCVSFDSATQCTLYP